MEELDDDDPQRGKKRGQRRRLKPKKVQIHICLSAAAYRKLCQLAERRRDNSASAWVEAQVMRAETKIVWKERRLEELKRQYAEYKKMLGADNTFKPPIMDAGNATDKILADFKLRELARKRGYGGGSGDGSD